MRLTLQALFFTSFLLGVIFSFQKKKFSSTPVESPGSQALMPVEDVKALERWPAPSPAGPQIKAETDFILKEISEIHSLNECYEKSCEASIDEKTKYFSIGQKLKVKLQELAAFARNNDLNSVELSLLGREFLANSDGYVQEAALDLLATQEIAQDNLEAILNQIIQSSDAELIHQAMLELKRYTYSGDQRHIQEVFAETLLMGAPFVAQAIAEYLGDFISQQSFLFYEDLVQKLDKHSIIHQYVISALHEFEKKSSAG